MRLRNSIGTKLGSVLSIAYFCHLPVNCITVGGKKPLNIVTVYALPATDSEVRSIRLYPSQD